ncbi:MAG: hypothetical protein QOF48_7 [Verrucomicrobiota bacterium]|jgi:hypothetical protein
MTEAPEIDRGVTVRLKPSVLLEERIEALRMRHVSVAVLTGLAMAVVVCVELLALAMFLDWWLDLPWGVRLVSLVLQIGLLSYILFRFILAPVLRQPDTDELALMVERKRPEFRSRLIASLQLTRPNAVAPGASSSLVGALVEETEALARPGDFRKLVPTDRLKKFAMLAVMIPVMAAFGFAAGHETCGALLKRVLLSTIPVPRKTHILVPDGHRVVGRGDTVRLAAFVQGIIPAQGEVEVKFRSRRTQEFPLEQNRDSRNHFARTLENVQDDFTYRFHLGDGVSETFNVRTVARPTVATIECEQEYPSYTGIPAAKRSLGDLSLLAGSLLRLKVTATKEVQSAEIKLVGVESNVVLRLGTADKREMRGQFSVPAKGLTGFQIQMLDVENMESRDSAVYRVDVLPDKPPAVRITYPERKEELVTRQATMLVGFEASDDFQIAKVRLKYKTDAADAGAEKSIEMDLGGEAPQRLKRRYEWKLAETLPGLAEGSQVEYWLEAEDNNNVTGPGIGFTDHQLMKVVSPEEKRADLLNRAGDYLGSISDVASDQEKLNKNLGQIIRAKAGIQ